jgi:hypothetical protein
MPDFPCIFKTTVNCLLSVWPPTSFQIVSHLRPSPVENFGYHPGSLKPDMLVKRANVLEGCVARRISVRRWVANRTDFIFDEHGGTPAPNRRVAVSSVISPSRTVTQAFRRLEVPDTGRIEG